MSQRLLLPVLMLVGLLELPAGASDAEVRQTFVTSKVGTGDLSTWADSDGLDGLAGANVVCQNLAEDAGLADAGTHLPEFRAWLSDANTDAWCNVQGLTGKRIGGLVCNGATLPQSGPWARTDGLLFGSSLAELSTVPVYVPVPLDHDENGVRVSNSLFFLTGSFANGTRSTADCTGWTTTTGQDQPGNSRATFSWATHGALALCSTPQRLACFELGEGLPVKKPSAPGHLAFVTSVTGPGAFGNWIQAGGELGLDAGDAVCRTLAEEARLPEPASFRVWASDTTEDAVCRVQGLTGLASTGCDGASSPLDAPYRRIDGFQIAAGIGDLTDGELATSLSIDQMGTPSGGSTFTGTAIDGTLVAGEHCGNWLSTVGTARPGSSSSLEAKWTSNGGLICSAFSRIYCMSIVITIFWDGFESAGTAAWSSSVPQ